MDNKQPTLKVEAYTLFDFDYQERELQEYFEEIMKEKKFTFRGLAENAEMDHRLIYEVVKKRRHLSMSNALKLSKGLRHNKNETDYFISLVFYKQANDDTEREFFRTQLIKTRSEALNNAKPCSIDYYELYASWHHTAVRSLIGIFPFKDDFKWLGTVLTPSISPEEAEKSVRLLERLDLIKKDKKGIYRLTNKNIWADISNEGKKRFHRECADLIKKQIFYTYPDDCQIFNATLGMSRNTYEIACNETKKLLEKIFKMVLSDKNADRVYQYQLALVPLSKNNKS